MNFRLTAVITLAGLLLMLLFSCNERDANCSPIKGGIFFSKPRGSDTWYKTIRHDSLQQEINLNTGDTSLWKVTWLSDCKYSVQYISGIHMESKEMDQFYRAATFVATVTSVTPDCYVFSAEATASKQHIVYSDTAWKKLPQRR
jgi:hypothetical protein